jgi:hypothetical protein
MKEGTHGKFPLPNILLLAVASTTCATALACCSLALAFTRSLMGLAHDGSVVSHFLLLCEDVA